MGLEHLKAFFSEENNQPIEEHQEEVKRQDKPILTASIERDKRINERYKEIGDNIKESERLRAKITKDINNNKPIDEILYTTLECIGNMTGDFTFTRQNIKNLKGRA